MSNCTKVIFSVSLSLAFFVAKGWSMDSLFYKTEKIKKDFEKQQAGEHQREREMTENGGVQQQLDRGTLLSCHDETYR